MSPGLAQSVQTRLVRYAKAIQVDPNHVLARYATERFLHNSRVRDFFDIHALARRQAFDGNVQATALRATCARRGTPVPVDVRLALTPAFADVAGKRAQWVGFVR
jgi:hypothetical protein